MMKANILIVDDTPANLHLLTGILTEQGYEVRAASNGPHALKIAQANPPDLILLDIKMPEMDGFEVCERLKADERTRNIPVIFISALQEVADKVNGFSLGAVDYIIKPFQAEEVLARVHTHLTLRNLQLHLEELVEERTAELQAALEHKTALLHEVHHRTKNNMQVMSGLLGLHAQSINDESTQQFLKGLQARIDSMSLVHQKLHRADLMRINLKEYIKDLARTMQVSYRVSSGRITFTFDTEPVLMTIDSAVPFGLLLNELISNALKHAFPDEREGEIHFSLHTMDEGERGLRVCDNGVGLPEDFELNKANTLGLQLIKILARQLQGTVEFQRKDPGTEVIIRFKEPYYEKRI